MSASRRTSLLMHCSANQTMLESRSVVSISLR
jgi:hypothetical protein